MAIDLSDLVPSLKREINPPGVDLFPDAVTSEYVGHLSDSFWEAVLDGVLEGYTSDGDQITPVTGTDDLAGEFQQLVIFYAGIRIVRNEIRNRNTLFRSKAGPVEFETQQSAQVLKELLTELARRRNVILARLSDLGMAPTVYIDGVLARTDSLYYGDSVYAGSSEAAGNNGLYY